MKKTSLLLLVLLASIMLFGQNDVIIQPPRPKVGVVLGGGGAKGAAHIGVLKYLEEIGMPVDYVAGTSMGSILGGLYAMGYSPDELATLIANVNWNEYIGNKLDRSTMSKETRERNNTTLLNIPFSLKSLLDRDPNTKFINSLPSAYVNNSSLINLFNDLCVGYQEEMDFNDMPIPFACVATDIVTGEEVVFRSGIVPTAMRASMAIPGVFSPVSIGDMVLVDGGLVNNFPADVLKEMGADIIIGVEVTSEKNITPDDIQSLPQLLGRLVTNSTNAKRKENRELCDVHIVPDISGYGMLSFTPEAIDTLVNRGYKKAAEYQDVLVTLKQRIDVIAGHPVSKELRAPKAYNLMEDSVLINSIEFSNVSNRDSHWLMRKGGLKVGNTYNKDEIEHAVSVFRGTGCFDEVTYNIKEQDSVHARGVLSDNYDLTIRLASSKPNVAGLGFRYDTQEGAALLLKLGLNEKKFNGSKLDLRFKLSYNPKASIVYTYAVPSLANFNVAYNFRNEHFRILMEPNKGINLHYRQQKVGFNISQFHLLNFSTSAGLWFSSTTFDQSSIEANVLDSLVFVHNYQLTPFVSLEYDNLDDSYFAKRGVVANTSFRYHIEPKSTNRCYDLSFAFQGYITPWHGKVTIIPQLYGRYVAGATGYFNMWNTYGGEIAGRHFEHQIPFIGLTTTQYTLDLAGVLRCDVRYNFYGKHYLTAMYNILGVLDDYSTAKRFYFDTQGAGLKYSYDSPLGPIAFACYWVKWEGQHMPGAYFSFGYTF